MITKLILKVYRLVRGSSNIFSNREKEVIFCKLCTSIISGAGMLRRRQVWGGGGAGIVCDEWLGPPPPQSFVYSECSGASEYHNFCRNCPKMLTCSFC